MKKQIFLVASLLWVALILYYGTNHAGIGASASGVAISDKVQHVVAFGMLAFLLMEAKIFKRLGSSVFLSSAYALVIESIQFFLPWRYFSLVDWMIGTAGTFAAYAFFVFLYEPILAIATVKLQKIPRK